MFEVGFLELVLIGVVALLVFGPEKLPSVMRTVGFWVGRMRAMVNSVKEDIDRELRLQEMEQRLKHFEEEHRLNELVNEPKKVTMELNQSLSQLTVIQTPETPAIAAHETVAANSAPVAPADAAVKTANPAQPS